MSTATHATILLQCLVVVGVRGLREMPTRRRHHHPGSLNATSSFLQVCLFAWRACAFCAPLPSVPPKAAFKHTNGVSSARACATHPHGAGKQFNRQPAAYAQMKRGATGVTAPTGLACRPPLMPVGFIGGGVGHIPLVAPTYTHTSYAARRTPQPWPYLPAICFNSQAHVAFSPRPRH